jgi:hypothetical protein
MGGLLVLVGACFAFAFYFAPSIVAVLRKKTNMAAIIVLNAFLGWSIIGWVISLVWALSADSQPQTIIVNNHQDSRRD